MLSLQQEAVLIQKIYAQFKKAENAKKLGVLYCLDSVTRQWQSQAGRLKQQIGHGAPDGTFGAAVAHVSELLPALMHDIIAVIPAEQREKLQKLINIWESAGTFPSSQLRSFSAKLQTAATGKIERNMRFDQVH